tara:strand:- start:621 stop:1937 length:1317 start_codon:yes stop_codon:yes gene_type:complete
MKSKLLNFFSELRGSYWYIPMLMSIFALLLSILTLNADHFITAYWKEQISWFHEISLDGARSLLSTIATSMIALAGVTFSMTIVAISFAGAQVGPRLISNFMRDRSNQIVLGIFIATFLFCLFILLALFNVNKIEIANSVKVIFIPQLSLIAAILFTISSIIGFVYFIHYVPESINISNIVGKIGGQLNRQIECQFPINIGKESSKQSHIICTSYEQTTKVISNMNGYIRILDGSSLIKIAKEHDLIIKLEVNIGDYITQDSCLLSIYSLNKIDKSIHKKCIDTFVVGHKRNQEHDILFIVIEMTEIIARALSPGVNDPFTAINCLDYLQSSLQKISKTTEPSPYRYDADDKLRLITKINTFSDFCEMIFSSIQPYVCKDKNAALHMMLMMISISKNISNHEHKTTLASHALSLKKATTKYLFVEDDKKIQNIYDQNW